MGIFSGILLFSVLIFVHELGHFTAAKMSGVQVNEFSMFMGPVIFKKQIGETQYSLRCIPIGGFCAMEGEDGDSDNPRSFGKAVWWKKLIILVAGAFMNLVIGIGLLTIFTYTDLSDQIVLPVIDQFEPGCTLNAEGGLQTGDQILKVDGERIYVASNFTLMTALNPGDYHDLEVRRDGKVVKLDHFEMKTHEFVDEQGNKELRYGIILTVKDATFHDRIRAVWNNAIDMVRMVRLSLQMLVNGQAGFKDLMGPVGIVQQISDVTKASPDMLAAVRNLSFFGAILAINLAVMNMLPIPALDGGRVFCLLVTTVIEAVTHKKVNPKYETYIHAAGMVLLMILMAVILFKDIFVIFKG